MSFFEKYRAKFPAQVEHLLHAKRSGRLGHAFLVTADREETRREFSLLIAQIAACPHSHNGEPCTQCRVCRELETESYPELHELTPVGKTFQIQVGDRVNPEPNSVRYFEEQFHLTSLSETALKVGIISDADRMNDEAQNALLKTLEEPPENTLLVLNTGNAASLLPTTRSRCQQLALLENRVEFSFPGAETVFSALGELCFSARGDLMKAEAAAEAILSVAASLNADAAEREKNRWDEKFSAAAEIDPALVKRLEKQYDSAAAGAYMKERQLFLSAIHSFCAELFLLSQGAPFETLPNPEMFQSLAQPLRVEPDRGGTILQEAEDLLFTLRFNVNEELALRTFAVNLAMK